MLELELLAKFNMDSNRRGDVSESETVSESLGEIFPAAFASFASQSSSRYQSLTQSSNRSLNMLDRMKIKSQSHHSLNMLDLDRMKSHIQGLMCK